MTSTLRASLLLPVVASLTMTVHAQTAPAQVPEHGANWAIAEAVAAPERFVDGIGGSGGVLPNADPTPGIPEPGTAALMIAGIAGLAAWARKRRRGD